MEDLAQANGQKNLDEMNKAVHSQTSEGRDSTKITISPRAVLSVGGRESEILFPGGRQGWTKIDAGQSGLAAVLEPNAETSKGWKPVSDRKIRVGIVGYGFCKFGAAFGFQDHPNVEVVAVSDLFPDRRDGLAKACRCQKTYDSLEELVKDDTIEAVFCATDPPHHAQHCMEVLKHGKHVAVNVPAVWGSLEQAEQLFEAVNKAKGLQYMMFETSYFNPGLWPMRQIYKAVGFGKHVYSEGEYYHYTDGKQPMPSYKGWRDGPPPLWYATHSTAYYIGVTGGTLTHVSCQSTPADWW